jgi:hypothetical protein
MSTRSYLEALHDAVMNPKNAVVGIVDDVLSLCRQYALHLDWRDNRCHITSVRGDEEAMLEVPLRKSVFRAILARVATLCDEQAPGTFAPYGGHGELSVGSEPAMLIRADWVNTTGEQRLTLMPVAPSNGQLARRSADNAKPDAAASSAIGGGN